MGASDFRWERDRKTGEFVSIETKVEMQWHDASVRAAVSAGSLEATRRAAELILEDANRHVPFDTGLLHDTGMVETLQTQGSSSAVISYSTPYARVLHEHPEYNFKNGREGKWLERALVRNREAAYGVMVAHMSDVLAGGFATGGAPGKMRMQSAPAFPGAHVGRDRPTGRFISLRRFSQ